MELFEYILHFLISAITGVITFISRTKSHLESSVFYSIQDASSKKVHTLDW